MKMQLNLFTDICIRSILIGQILTTFIMSPLSSLACSAFYGYDNGTHSMAKSYDWSISHGYILVNKANIKKKSLAALPGDSPLEWISKYGSISFNQYGQEFPLGGMNQKGLAIEVLWLDNSQYPSINSQKTMNELQWIQYHLDTAATVTDLVASSQAIRISPVFAKVHYFACDPTGTCAVIEYINQELRIYSNIKGFEKPLPVPTITNHSYELSSAYIKEFKGFGGNRDLPSTRLDSLSRFVLASEAAKQPLQLFSSLPDKYFIALDKVATPNNYSKWNIHYNLSDKVISFKPRYSNARIRVQVDAFNYSCKRPALALELPSHSGSTGESTFSKMTLSKNRKLVKQSLEGQLPTALINQAINFPRTTKCSEN